MLCLSRRVGERIMIGDDITLTVLEIRKGVVRLGITAPKSLAVCREEVLGQFVRKVTTDVDGKPADLPEMPASLS